jgi:hypothetical protein
MCWNQDISLNTFIFACFSLLFIFLANSYSKYKLKAFDNPLVYLFLFAVASMQLIEFFLWRNLKNDKMNEWFSKIASFIVTIQPATLMLMIQNTTVKYSLLLIYILFFVIYFEFKRLYSPIIFHTSIGKTGHLRWEWIDSNGYGNKLLLVVYLLLYSFTLLLINNTEIAVIGLLSLFVSLFFYYKDKAVASMWCWLSNIIFLYFIVNILLVKPFYEYNALC